MRHRIRKKISGTADRPRLAVFRSLKHIYAQAIDDAGGTTIAHVSTRDEGVRAAISSGCVGTCGVSSFMTEPPVGATATIIFLCAMVGLLRDLVEYATGRHETCLFGVDPQGECPDPGRTR